MIFVCLFVIRILDFFELRSFCLNVFTHCSFNFSVFSSWPTSFRKFISDSRIDDGCDALFFIAILRIFGIRVIIKISVIFFLFCNHVY